MQILEGDRITTTGERQINENFCGEQFELAVNEKL